MSKQLKTRGKSMIGRLTVLVAGGAGLMLSLSACGVSGGVTW